MTTQRIEKAFTIVELLIVIVVIAILASISVVAYNGIQDRANNVSSLSLAKQWQDSLEIYRAQTGNMISLPGVDGGAEGFCLGTGYPNAKCNAYKSTVAGDYYAESTFSTVTSQLDAKSVDYPKSITSTVAGKRVGPYIKAITNQLQITVPMRGAPGVCADNNLLSSFDHPSDNYSLCYIRVDR